MAIIRKPYRESSTGMVNIRNPIFSAALYQTTGDSVKYPVSNPLLKRKKGIIIFSYKDMAFSIKEDNGNVTPLCNFVPKCEFKKL